MSGDGSMQRQDNATAARGAARIRRARVTRNAACRARNARSVEARKTRIAAQRCKQWMQQKERNTDVVVRTDRALERCEGDVACAEDGGPGSALGRGEIALGLERGEGCGPGRVVEGCGDDGVVQRRM